MFLRFLKRRPPYFTPKNGFEEMCARKPDDQTPSAKPYCNTKAIQRGLHIAPTRAVPYLTRHSMSHPIGRGMPQDTNEIPRGLQVARTEKFRT